MIAVAWLTALVLPDDVVFGAWSCWGSLLGATVAGFALGFWFIGGYVALKHVSLRLALALQRRLPLRLIGFLDPATRLILLRRAGGGWVFIHRRLQEHLAAGAPDAR
jgi:hypothetical protein